jgi:hypothetical protein
VKANQLVCIENTRESRWIWTIEHSGKFCAIESAAYSHPEQGYLMQFNDSREFDRWLNLRLGEGWAVAKILDVSGDDYEALDAMINKTKNNLFKALKQ